MSSTSPHPTPFPEDKHRTFLWEAASRFFDEAIVFPDDPEHRALMECVMLNPPRTRAGLAAALSFSLGTDLIHRLPRNKPSKYAPGMALMIGTIEGYPDDDVAFITGGALGWDRAITRSGGLGPSLPGDAPESESVRLANPGEVEEALRQWSEDKIHRIAGLVAIGSLLPKEQDNDIPDFL